MRPYFEFSTAPKGNKINEPLDKGVIRSKERLFDKQKTYIMCVPFSVFEAKVTQVNEAEEDEDITYRLQRTGEEVYFVLP